ncbi:hypothetical protein Dimus_000434, partial [Dionaea muscipula]
RGDQGLVVSSSPGGGVVRTDGGRRGVGGWRRQGWVMMVLSAPMEVVMGLGGEVAEAVMMDDEAVVMMQQGRLGAGGVVLAWRWSGEDRWWSTWCWWLAEARVGDDGVVGADGGGDGSR